MRWTREKVLEELQKIIDQTGDMPSAGELSKCGRGDLRNAIFTLKISYHELRDFFGLSKRCATNHYWTKERVIEEIIGLKEEWGKSPTQTTLGKMGRFDLIGSIGKLKITYKELRRLVGCVHVPKRKWTREMVIKEMKDVEKDMGQFPDQKTLNKIGRSDLSGGIGTVGITYNELRDILGYDRLKNVAGYWNRNRVIEEFTKVHDEMGRFPDQKTLNKIGRSDISGAIGKFKISYRELRELFGYTTIKPDGYWHDFDNLSKEIISIIKDGKFPPLAKIQIEIGNSARNAIRFYGGIESVAKKMGYNYIPSNFLVTSDGHHVQSHYEYVFDEYLYANGVSHEVNGVIAEDGNYRYDFKVGDYYFEIWGLSGTKSKLSRDYDKKRALKEQFYKDRGLDLISIESNVFSCSFKNINKYFSDLLASLPSKKWNSVEISNPVTHRKFWSDDKILDGLKKILDDYGEIPSLNWLRGINQKLYYAIYEHGGKKYFFDRLGIDCKVRHFNRKWTKETILKKFKDISDELGHFPTEREIKKTDCKYLQTIAYNNGLSLTKISEILGFKPRKRGHYIDK